MVTKLGTRHNQYEKKIPAIHRTKILAYLGWQPLNQHQLDQLHQYLFWHAKNQQSPKKIFLMAIDYCGQNKIELPSYNQITLLLTKAYNYHELGLIEQIDNLLYEEKKELLTSLIKVDSKDPRRKKLPRSPLTLLKYINQLLRPTDIQENVDAFLTIKSYFYKFQSLFEKINLSDQGMNLHKRRNLPFAS